MTWQVIVSLDRNVSEDPLCLPSFSLLSSPSSGKKICTMESVPLLPPLHTHPLTRSMLIRNLLPYLPPDAQALLLHPPSLSSPQSFLPLIRLAWPLTRWLVVIFAFWIVWSTLAGVFGYFSRFLRFTMKIGPIVGLIAMVMSQSGHGSLEDVMGAVKQWAGFGMGNGARAGTGQGIPGLENLQDMWQGVGSSAKRRSTRCVLVLSITPYNVVFCDILRLVVDIADKAETSESKPRQGPTHYQTCLTMPSAPRRAATCRMWCKTMSSQQ